MRRTNTEEVSVYCTFLSHERERWVRERSQGDFYGLSGPLGLSTVWIMSTSKAPPNGTALGVGKCPWEILFTVHQIKVPLKGNIQILTASQNKPSASVTAGNQEQPSQPPGLPPRQSGVPTAGRLAGLPLTYCIKYRIWLKNCLVKIKFKSPCRSM